MKTKVTSLLVVFAMATISCTAQRTITVEAQNSDISNNLDLQAVASTFGESSNLEDFERRLNDYDSQISNLDMNNDGEVDYLRVIENMENNVHVVVIQAVLDRDVYQDVATIVVERNNYRRTRVQVIGDPYIYGDNYVIEPVYVYTPSIFSYLWNYNYHCWYSPYYYGYYPRYYRNRQPFELNIYLSHVYRHINHEHRYFYTDRQYNEYADRLHSSMGRNDYGNRYPDRNFNHRNSNVTNKRDFDNARTNNTIYDRRSYDSNRPGRTLDDNSGSRNNGFGTGSRSVESRNSSTGINRTQDDIYQNRTTRTDNQGSRNNGQWQNNGSRTERNTQTYTPPTQPSTPVTRNADVARPANEGSRNNQGGSYQRPDYNSNRNAETRPQPTVPRENTYSRPAPVVNQPSRPAPVVTQPSRPVETRTIERKPTPTPPSRDVKIEKKSRESTERR
jgi:hypothetical protein